jgi:hypothetical protein
MYSPFETVFGLTSRFRPAAMPIFANVATQDTPIRFRTVARPAKSFDVLVSCRPDLNPATNARCSDGRSVLS